MSDDNSFQMSQGYDVIPPKPGRAYPILCGEWEHLKTQIKEIKTSFGWYYTGGTLLHGAAITTLIAILIGACTPEANSDSQSLVIAWAVVVTTGLIGFVSLYFANESREIAEKKATEVVTQMELIEQRYEQE